jgi:pilus assembly protein CpaB
MAYFGGSVSARPWPKIDIRFAVIFICSFVGLAICLFLARDLSIVGGASSGIAPEKSARLSQQQMMPVAVPIREIAAGTWLSPSMFRFEQRNVDGFEQQVVQGIDEIQGSYARTALSQGTPLLRTALGRGASSTEITDRIPNGHRAVAIPVNALTGVEGWVQPGASVDIVWSIERSGQLMVSTIVENARVLSVERSLEAGIKKDLVASTQPRHITLLVPTRDAQKIQLAKGAGSLNLSLRGSSDAHAAGDSTLTTESILARSNPRPAILGRVHVDGISYVLRGGALVPVSDEEISEEM